MKVVYGIDTQDPVAFIAIDDGYYQPADALAYVQSAGLLVTPFLTFYAVSQYPPTTGSAGAAYFTAMAGGDPTRIGVHGKRHIDLRTLDLAHQTADLTNSAHWLGQWLGCPTPTLFAPPYGLYNADTLTAASTAGYRYVRRWTHDLGGGQVTAKWGTPTPRPGDILITHFSADPGQLLGDLQTAAAVIAAAGLMPAYLADYGVAP